MQALYNFALFALAIVAVAWTAWELIHLEGGRRKFYIVALFAALFGIICIFVGFFMLSGWFQLGEFVLFHQ